MTPHLWLLSAASFASGAFFAAAVFLADLDDANSQSTGNRDSNNQPPTSLPPCCNLITQSNGDAAMNTASIEFHSIQEARAYYARRRANAAKRRVAMDSLVCFKATCARLDKHFVVGDTTLI